MTKKEEIKSTVEEIVKRSSELLVKKLANGGITSKNEASLQLELAYILKSLGQLYEFKKEDDFHVELEKVVKLKTDSTKSGNKKAKIDIYIVYKVDGEECKAAIELKYPIKSAGTETDYRCEVFADISNLERYNEDQITDVGFLVFATDNPHYYNNKNNSEKEYGEAAKEFDFRNGKTHKAGKQLVRKKLGTDEVWWDITLSNDYEFVWEKPIPVTDSEEQIYSLVLKVPKG
jgi:hypothetical protein